MKKHWLVTLGIYSLGVATFPGILIGVRWWQDAESPTTPKFIDVRDVTVNAFEEKETDSDTFAEPTSRITANTRSHQPISFFDEEPFEFDSAVPTRQTEPVRVNVASDVETPVLLAQKASTRKQPHSRTAEDKFEPQPALQLDDFNEVDVPKSRATPESAKAELSDGIESLADVELTEEQKAKLTTLREKIAELTKAKAELINEQTLTETINTLEKQISDLHAAQKLLSAQQILKALAEEFPDSPAAAKAKRMLEAAESRKAPKSSRESFDFEKVQRY